MQRKKMGSGQKESRRFEDEGGRERYIVEGG